MNLLLVFFFLQPLTCHFCCHLPVVFVLNVAVLILLWPSMATMYENLCGNCVGRVDIFLTVHCRAILKTVKSMCNDIKKIKCTLMKCHKNDNSTSSTQLPHKFSYIVAILDHNHFESPNTCPR
jgi:hypothetical protein